MSNGNTVVFKRIHTANRGVSTYKAAGFPGVVQLAKAAFNGEHPDEITVQGVPDAKVSERAAKAKMTPEEKEAAKQERKARLAQMTPAQRAQEKVDRAKAALDKVLGAASGTSAPAAQ